MIGTECEYSVEWSHDDLESLLVCPHGWGFGRLWVAPGRGFNKIKNLEINVLKNPLATPPLPNPLCTTAWRKQPLAHNMQRQL